jgi:hypothetical protein
MMTLAHLLQVAWSTTTSQPQGKKLAGSFSEDQKTIPMRRISVSHTCAVVSINHVLCFSMLKIQRLSDANELWSTAHSLLRYP